MSANTKPNLNDELLEIAEEISEKRQKIISLIAQNAKKAKYQDMNATAVDMLFAEVIHRIDKLEEQLDRLEKYASNGINL